MGLVIFDPKYRAGASLLDGLRDMHVYRDAILNHSGARLVKAAVALAPRPRGLPEVTSVLHQIDPAYFQSAPATIYPCSLDLDLSLTALEDQAVLTSR